MVIARDQITLSWQLDVQGTVYYYKKQSSTATAPEKPTSYPPSGWTTTEPGYSSGETSTLYVTVCTLYDNGSFEYSDVSVSASFEAAKEAYNKAVAAQTAASNAITAANGKTKIFYQDSAPTAGMAVGDMWFDTDGGNAVYQYTATGWVLRQFGNGSIVAGTITANEIAANTITANKLNVSTLSSIAANIGTVTAGVLKSSDYSYSSGNYSATGMIIDLSNKVIRMPNTAILANGTLYTRNANVSGTITATALNIIEAATFKNSDQTKSATLSYENVNLAYRSFTIDVINNTMSSSSATSNEDLFSCSAVLYGRIYASSLYCLGSANIPAARIEDLTSANAEIFDLAVRHITVYGTLTGHASLDLPLTGGTLSGSVTISTTGRGYNLTDASGTSYGGLYENGNNLWIGAASSTSPHHRGAQGNTYISAGYNNTNGAGNSTIYISVPSLSGSTWSHTPYAVLHSGNYSSYALPLSGGTLTGNLTISASDTSERQVRIYNSLGNIYLNVSSAGNHGLYSGTKGGWIIYCTKDAASTNSWAYIPRSLNVTGHVHSSHEIRSGGKSTASDGHAGGILSGGGHLYLQQGTSGSNINFIWGAGTAVTSKIYESASGTLTASANFNITGNLTVSTTSTSVDRTVTVANGNASGSIRAASGGAFGLYVTKTGGVTRTAVYLTAMDSNGTYRTNWNPSDRRVKNIIGDMPDSEAETLLRRLKIYNFRYKTDATKTVQNGMIAQQVRDVLSECGYGYRLYLDIRSADGEDFLYSLNSPEQDVQYGIDYARMTPILWKGWQIHDGKILNHEDRIATLERENNRLKKEIALLKGEVA